MDEEQLQKLERNLRREEDHPPLVVRPDPHEPGAFQVLDGHQRWAVLGRLGQTHALCYVWPCDDEQALLLIATLNRLVGTDEPRARAELLKGLSDLLSLEDLAALVPEDSASIRQNLELLDFGLEDLLAAFARPEEELVGLRSITFVVTPEDEGAVEEAVAIAAAKLDGKNRRGRALGAMARRFLAAEESPDERC